LISLFLFILFGQEAKQELWSGAYSSNTFYASDDDKQSDEVIDPKEE